MPVQVSWEVCAMSTGSSAVRLSKKNGFLEDLAVNMEKVGGSETSVAICQSTGTSQEV